MMKTLKILVLFSLFLLSPAIVYANIGVPMIFITLPLMVLGLIPIILMESFVFFKIIKVPFVRALKIMTICNLFSTCIGLPLTWIILFILQIVSGGAGSLGLATPFDRFLSISWQAPWLVPYESELYWMVPSANLSLIIPFFLASWFIEYHVAKRMIRKTDIYVIKNAIFKANSFSYLILLFLSALWLISSIHNQHLFLPVKPPLFF